MHTNTHTHIDLTSPESALDYLRSLPSGKDIEIIDARVAIPDPANCAIRAITTLSSYEWATLHERWDWTAGELADAMDRELREQATIAWI